MGKINVGVVVKHSDGRFLITKRRVGDMLDIGILGGLVNRGNVAEELKEMLINQTSVDFTSSISEDVLRRGTDEDGDFLILYAENNFEFKELKNKVQPNTEFVWVSYSKIKKMYKEGRINSDQFAILTLAELRATATKNRRNAMKVNHRDARDKKRVEHDGYQNYVDRYGDTRLMMRMVHGRNVKPCGRECWEYGIKIAEGLNHGSFKNFHQLMDDRDFILTIAKITPNPVDCENYFYYYVNEYIKNDACFRLEFLKAIYLNENIFKLADINLIVTSCGLEAENEILLQDLNFKRQLRKRLDGLCVQDVVPYNCSGEDRKELHDYKVKANEVKVLFDNIRKGIDEILKSFTCNDPEDKKEETQDVDNSWVNRSFEIRHGY